MAYGLTPVVKSSILRIVQGAIIDQFHFQYNPTTYQETISVEWIFSQAPGQYLPCASFARFGNTEMRFQLFLYGREANVSLSTGTADVKKEVARLKLFVSPGPQFSIDTPQFVSPGRSKLIMGERVWNGVVNSVSVSHEMFDRDFNLSMVRVDIVFTVVSFGLESELAHLNAIRSRAGLPG